MPTAVPTIPLRLSLFAATLACACLLSACGIKGPLYLHRPPPAPAEANHNNAVAPAAAPSATPVAAPEHEHDE